MALTSLGVEKAGAKAKPYKMADKDGLFLLVKPGGKKYWRFKYRFAGKEKMLGFGVYPEVSLKEARTRTEEARKMLRDGIDPSAHKQGQKRAERLKHASSFRAVAEEWHTKNLARWTPNHGAKILRRLELHVFPGLGGRPVSDIKPPELLEVLRKIEERDTTEILRRVKECGAGEIHESWILEALQDMGPEDFGGEGLIHDDYLPVDAKNVYSITAKGLAEYGKGRQRVSNKSRSDSPELALAGR
ncbi:MAG: integrase arm-type DNA-binding domain-containing protein [Pseudomonadaceae bacterium]|nr:integrase arm-type DNA-binding domain-containing protein [Pseudomonadaceae bacterium]